MTEKPKRMSLCSAMSLLAEAHTRDDELVGFTIETFPHIGIRFGWAEYIEAWRAVREAVGRPTAPSPSGAE